MSVVGISGVNVNFNAWTLGHNPSVFAVDHSALLFGTAGRSNFWVPVEAVYIIY